LVDELLIAEEHGEAVKNHIHRLLRRVGANDRLDVAEMAGVQELAN
jgi:DNA-binding NarL/FixJ family response regulator